MSRKLSKRQLLSAICHSCIFFCFTGFSLLYLVLINAHTDDDIVRKNSKEALNAIINYFVGWFIILLSFFFIAISEIGWLAIPFVVFGLFIQDIFLEAIAAIFQITTNRCKVFYYPFKIRFF